MKTAAEKSSNRVSIASHPSDQDPAQLRLLIEEMRQAINRISDDRVLTETVNALFVDQNVDETTFQLRYLNDGGKPQWAF